MIRMRGVKKAFGSRAALVGLDLDVSPGARIALVGPNGSGKTTLIRCLLGALAFEGSITVAGHDVVGDHAAALTHVAYVPQRAPRLTVPVREVVRFWSKQRGLPADRLVAEAGRFGLDLDLLGPRTFDALSGGMQQKLLACMALATECNVMVFDEPTANLDPASRAMFFEALARRTPAPTVVLSSHRIEEISGLVDRVVGLAEGAVAFDGGLEAFLANPEQAAAAGIDIANLVPFRRNA